MMYLTAVDAYTNTLTINKIKIKLTTSIFMKKLILWVSMVSVAFVSCTKDLLVPEEEKPEWLGGTIYEELQNPDQRKLTGTFNTYLRLVDDLGYAEVLGRTGSMTAFPANDEAFNRFFNSDNAFGVSSYEQLTTPQKKLLLNSSLLKNALLTSMLSNIPQGDNNVSRGQAVKHETNVSVIDDIQFLSNRGVMPQGNSYWDAHGKTGINCVFDATVPMLFHLTREQMLNNYITTVGTDCDFGILRGEPVGYNVDNADTAYVFQNKILNQDVVCQNGYIHQLTNVLVPPGNLGQVLRTESNAKLFSRMLDYHCAPYYDATTTNNYNSWARQNGAPILDSIFQVRYFSTKSQGGVGNTTDPDGSGVASNMRLDWDPGWNQYYSSSTAANSLNDFGAIFVPSDDAVIDYFVNGSGSDFVSYYGVKGLPNTPENLPQHLDSIFVNGNGVITSIVNNHMKSSFVASVPSKFHTLTDIGSGEFMEISAANHLLQVDGHYDVKIANNGVIYKLNKLFAPDEFRSVIGGALTLPNFDIMNYFLSDKKKGSVNSVFGADMYYYLMAMKSHYAFFTMHDNDYANPIIDPVSLGWSQPRALSFYTYLEPQINKKTGEIFRYDRKYALKAYPFNPKTGVINYSRSNDLGQIAVNGNTSFASQVCDYLDYQTVVLESNSFYGEGNNNHYYLTKNGGAIYVTGAGSESDCVGRVYGGAQLAHPDNLPASKIKERSLKENGFSLVLDRPIQTAYGSVYSFLNNNKDKFSEFLELCAAVSSTTYLNWVRIKDTAPSKQNSYRIWNDTLAIQGDANVRFFNGYNYTLYAPDNEAVEKAYAMGLPTPAQLEAVINGDYSSSELKAARELAADMIEQMRAFIRYHFQNNSVFADNYLPATSYQSMYSSDLGIASNIRVSSRNGVLSVTDVYRASQGLSPLTITAENLNDATKATEKIVNKMTRDIQYNVDAKSATSLLSSSFAVIHQISTPLCYSASGRYDEIKCPSSNRDD